MTPIIPWVLQRMNQLRRADGNDGLCLRFPWLLLPLKQLHLLPIYYFCLEEHTRTRGQSSMSFHGAALDRTIYTQTLLVFIKQHVGHLVAASCSSMLPFSLLLQPILFKCLKGCFTGCNLHLATMCVLKMCTLSRDLIEVFKVIWLFILLFVA